MDDQMVPCFLVCAVSQRQQDVGINSPQKASLVLVCNLLRLVVNIVKACFGIQPLNHIAGAHGFISSLFGAIEKDPNISIITSSLTSFCGLCR